MASTAQGSKQLRQAESRYIRQVAGRYGTEHSEYDLNPDSNLRDTIEEFAYYSDDPSADAGALPIWYLSKLSRTKTTVALSGEGADELFGGYLTYRADQIAAHLRKFPQKALRFALRVANGYPVSNQNIGFDYKAKRLLEGCLFPAERAHAFWNGTFTQSQKDAMLKSICLVRSTSILRKWMSRQPRVRTSWNATCGSISVVTCRTTSW